jgi:hypothetical protein
MIGSHLELGMYNFLHSQYVKELYLNPACSLQGPLVRLAIWRQNYAL